MSWHTDRDLLDRYVRGDLAAAAAWSVETHVTACASCRAELSVVPSVADPAGAGVDDERLGTLWLDAHALVAARERSFVERLLVRVGVADHDARLLAATPSLTRSWLLGVALVLAGSVGAAWGSGADGGRSLLVFLLLAPLVPVAGVAVAFGPRVDPTYELGVVAPMRSSRLLLLRAMVVLVSSLLLAAAGALALPVWSWSGAAWILPSLGLTSGALACSTRWHPLAAATGIAVAWIALVLVTEISSSATLAAFGVVGQVAMLGLTIASAAVLVAQRDHIDPAVQR